MGSEYKPLFDIKANLDGCLLCGKCRSVCPVFEEIGVETVSPRGRVALASALLNNELSLSRLLKDKITNCLRCMACSETCPSFIKPDVVPTAIYQIVSKGIFANLLRGVIFRILLKRGRLLPPFTSFWSNLFKIVSPLIPEWTHLRHIIPLPTLKGVRYLPVFASVPFSYYTDYYNKLFFKNKWKHKVALFIGCAGNLVYPNTVHSMIRVYMTSGVGVYIPENQGCCGYPAWAYGDEKTYKKRISEFVRGFSGLDVEAIVTICATCGHNLIDSGIGKESGMMPVYDALVYLARVGGYMFKEMKSSVAYHLPCHLGRGQGANKIVDKFLRDALGKSYVGMILEGKCCGGGGIYYIVHPDIASRVGEKKIDMFIKSGADVLTTSCHSCRIFLTEAMSKMGKVRVISIWEVLSNAL
ncbi:MAG: (Fe-S)-binding protein [bacterium]